MSKTVFTRYSALRNLVLLLILCCGTPSLHAQVTSSPYSRYGLGDFQFNGFAQNLGLGGGGIGMRNDSLLVQYINLANPASLTSNNVVAYETGILSNTSLLQNTTDRTVLNRTMLSHIGMAFPVTKWWSAAFGLVPYSSVGYKVSSSEQNDTLGTITYNYEGSGGISQVFMAHAFRPFSGLPSHFKNSERYDILRAKNDTDAIRRMLRNRNALSNISIGGEVSYLFGSLTNTRRDIFPDSSYMLNTRIIKNTLIHDVYANYGIQYRFRLHKSLNPKYLSLRENADSLLCKREWFKNSFSYKSSPDSACNRTEKLYLRSNQGIQVSFGAVLSLPMSVHATSDWLAQTYRVRQGFEIFKDTIYQVLNSPGRIDLPLMFGFGFALKKDFKWQFQADYSQQLWENFTFLGAKTDLRNSQRFTAGFQYQPKAGYRRNYFYNVQYRAGVRFYQTYLELKDTPIQEYGITLGAGFPLRDLTRLNLGVELGRRGTTTNNLIMENYARVVFAMSINDRWFQRAKYD